MVNATHTESEGTLSHPPNIMANSCSGQFPLPLNFYFCFVVVAVKREDGFHIDLDDYLQGLLTMANELVSIMIIASFQFAQLSHGYISCLVRQWVFSGLDIYISGDRIQGYKFFFLSFMHACIPQVSFFIFIYITSLRLVFFTGSAYVTGSVNVLLCFAYSYTLLR